MFRLTHDAMFLTKLCCFRSCLAKQRCRPSQLDNLFFLVPICVSDPMNSSEFILRTDG